MSNFLKSRWYSQRIGCEATLARQKELGVVPPETELAPRPSEVKPWDEMTADEQRLATRLMETYAGFAEHTDYHAGLLVDALRLATNGPNKHEEGLDDVAEALGDAYSAITRARARVPTAGVTPPQLKPIAP